MSELGSIFKQRADGFVNATQICRRNGKHWRDYFRRAKVQEFFSALSRSEGRPVNQLIEVVKTGPFESRGVWVDFQIGLHLAMWCSPEFAAWIACQIDLVQSDLPTCHREHAEAKIENVFGQSLLF